MGFLKKIFGRSKKNLASSSSESTTNSLRRKLSRKERKALKKVNQSGSFLSSPHPQSNSGKPKTPRSSDRPAPVVDLEANTRTNEEYVRKPSFQNQRQQQHRIPVGNGNNSNSFSPQSESRSPNSYEDRNAMNGARGDRYSVSNVTNSNSNRRPQQRNSPNDNNYNMVQFGGDNAFNDSSSPSSYQDYNDENTNYSNRKSPPQQQQQYQQHADDNFSPKSNNSYNNTNSNLQYDHVQRFEQQNNGNGNHYNNLHPYEIQQSKKVLQLTRLPNGQLAAMERMNNSSPLSTSSDFDLSTDAEDNEYNHIRNTTSANIKPMLQPHSPSSEEDDGDIPIRHHYGDHGAMVMTARSKNYFSDSDHDTLNSPSGDSRGNGSLSLTNKQSKSPQDNSYEFESGDYETGGGNGKSRFTFDNEFEEALVKSKRKSPLNNELRPPSPTAFQKINKTNPNTNARNNYDDEKSQQTEKSFDSAVSPRTLAIRATQNMRNKGKLAPDLYPNSPDLEYEMTNGKQQPLQPPAQAVDLLPPRTSRSQDSIHSGSGTYSQKEINRKRNNNTNEGVISNFADFETFTNNEFGVHTPKSVTEASSPVSELLAQAQARRKNQSSNSEPVLGAAMLIQQIYNDANSANPYDQAIETTGSMTKQHERKMEKDKFLRMLNEGKGSGSDDDDDSDKEKDVNESWLMEEVTGALGPRGNTADLESLGERSNKSKASLGNKSHRSHRSHRSNKSYKSHKSSTSQRRTKRSDESVGSRHSRSSRYSIKSTKSYLSQMSHESRSVANDLIRLEMQLAMVNKNGENEVKKQLELDAQRKGLKDGISVGEHSIGVSSYASRKSYRKSGVPKRAKTNVKAPPGKLGIILANRTDSKGTVVSGVRTTSVLADKIAPGDRIIAIDDEDVSRMTVPEITAIMARKSDFERILTVLITPKN